MLAAATAGSDRTYQLTLANWQDALKWLEAAVWHHAQLAKVQSLPVAVRTGRHAARASNRSSL